MLLFTLIMSELNKNEQLQARIIELELENQKLKKKCVNLKLKYKNCAEYLFEYLDDTMIILSDSFRKLQKENMNLSNQVNFYRSMSYEKCRENICPKENGYHNMNYREEIKDYYRLKKEVKEYLRSL